MAGEIFLKLDGITGESKDKLHPELIECSSVSMNVSNPSSIGGGTTGHGSGRSTFGDIVFTMRPSKATAHLWDACAKGTHIATGEVYLSKAAGEDSIDWLVLKLDKPFVSSWSLGGTGADAVETVTIASAKIEFTYKPQKTDDGSADADIVKVWNIEERHA